MKRFTIVHPPKFLLMGLMLLLFVPSLLQACRIGTTSTASKSPALATITNAGNQFGFQLYQQLSKGKPGEGQFFSPFSVFAALAMTSEGMGGPSLELIRKAMGLPEEATLHEGLQALGQALNPQDAPYALAVANAIWPELTSKVKPAFLTTVQKVYLGTSKPLDYIQNFEASRLAINAWVEKQTHERIKNLLPKGSIDPDTRMVLTNAIYFKGKWKVEFDKKLTQTAPFLLENGSKVQTPLMYQSHDVQKLNYAQFNGAQVVELPYKGDDLSMVVMLPELGKINDLEAKLNAKEWETLRKSLQPQDVNVWLPSFKMEIGGSIKGQLSDMGLASLFAATDFSRMFESSGDLKISDVFHKAFVEVNEEGTEAAAATAVIVKNTDASEDYTIVQNFRADHPFLFMIQHRATGNILFMGKVMNPAA